MSLCFSARRLACAGALAALAAAPAAFAQPSPWAPTASEGLAVGVEVLKPFFDTRPLPEGVGDGYGAGSSTTFLTLGAPLRPGLRLVAELPVTYLDLDRNVTLDGFESGDAEDDRLVGDPTGDLELGNPYLGVEAALAEGVTLEAGARLPLVDDGERYFASEWLLVAPATDPDRVDAFAEGYLPVGARVAWRRPLGEGAALRLRGGPSVLVNVSDEAPPGDPRATYDPGFYAAFPARDGVLVLAGYSADVSAGAGPLRLVGGLSGVFDVGGGGVGSARTGHQAALALDAAGGRVRPGAVLRVPLGGADEAGVDYVVGLRLAADLR